MNAAPKKKKKISRPLWETVKQTERVNERKKVGKEREGGNLEEPKEHEIIKLAGSKCQRQIARKSSWSWEAAEWLSSPQRYIIPPEHFGTGQKDPAHHVPNSF